VISKGMPQRKSSEIHAARHTPRKVI